MKLLNACIKVVFKHTSSDVKNNCDFYHECEASLRMKRVKLFKIGNFLWNLYGWKIPYEILKLPLKFRRHIFERTMHQRYDAPNECHTRWILKKIRRCISGYFQQIYIDSWSAQWNFRRCIFSILGWNFEIFWHFCMSGIFGHVSPE